MNEPLTKKQYAVYRVVKSHFDTDPLLGITLAEIASKTNSKSKSGVHRLVTELEKKGYIGRVKNAHCGIYLTGKKPLLKRDA